MTKSDDKQENAMNEFMLAEFQAALSRRATFTSSIENLQNIHLTIVSIALGALVSLWTPSSNSTSALTSPSPIPITIIALSLLLIIGLTIQYRISVHDISRRWDGYRYRLAEQFFLDRYSKNGITNYTEWMDKPDQRITINKGSFGRSPVAITALVNSLIAIAILFFSTLYLNFPTWLAVLISVILGIAAWYIQRWNFHREAKRQGLKLQLKADAKYERQWESESVTENSKSH